ncbi:hypothetical protein GOP47_0023066 [Adiantum capillus-veneris]|uniref:Uncharacterized protein n=1 Tax=Adiantum capillus-veneris TaxID=13818 RepID=A0A9D4Z6L2_ADICA|nr:hypothetical protein GOP47_0023066 [Adiantum capillus-veneris]
MLDKSLSEDMAMGILGTSIGLEVVAFSNVAQTLVASHMRMGVVVSEERDRLFNIDTVEPILGEAAAGKILQSNGMLLKVLYALENACKKPYVRPQGGTD